MSLLLWEGRTLTYVADQAGHSVATLANHYAGVLDELEDQPKIPAHGSDQAGQKAPEVCVPPKNPTRPRLQNACKSAKWAILGSNQ